MYLTCKFKLYPFRNVIEISCSWSNMSSGLVTQWQCVLGFTDHQSHVFTADESEAQPGTLFGSSFCHWQLFISISLAWNIQWRNLFLAFLAKGSWSVTKTHKRHMWTVIRSHKKHLMNTILVHSSHYLLKLP